MDIHDCSSTTNTPCFIFPPPSSSQIPMILHHRHNINQPSSSWTTLLPQPHNHHDLTTSFNNRLLSYPTVDVDHHHPFHFQSSPPPSSHAHGGFFKKVVDDLHNAYESSTTTSATVHRLGEVQAVLPSDQSASKMSHSGEMVDSKAIAASKSHNEAERRRRQRINNHLTKLRTLLPNTTKTDKASLLAEVIQHVKDLKSQTSVIAKQIPVPSEIDELTIDNKSDKEGRMVIRASLCCEDRLDLLPDLIRTLKTLRLRTLKAEITTLGRRVKNVLFVTGEDHLSSTYDNQQMTINHRINIVEDALTAIIDKTNDRDDSSKFPNIKRQRTNNIHVFEH